MKLLNKGFYAIEGAVDPETILWENLGTPASIKAKRFCLNFIVIIIVFAVSFFGLWGIQLFEKLYNKWVKTDCTGNEFFTIDNAYTDFMLPEQDQQGLIYCYCNQMYE
jgi:hypothetical protein